ncbi:MAG: magnesium transporter [Candidatus Omnitrophica bacterium]|nr:magnesium transporter [Candidatus Omnitrophota bacterium]
MLRELLSPEIRELIETKNWRTLKEILSEWPAQDIVDLIHNVEENEGDVIFRILPRDLAAQVFSELDKNEQKKLLKQISSEHIKEIFLELTPDDRTDFFEELPAKVTKKLLNLLPPEERKETMVLLGYPEKSVGRLMTPRFVAIRDGWTVSQALEHIRKFAGRAETIDVVYVVDENWRLLDEISLKDLILARPHERISNLMDKEYHSVVANADQEVAVEIMKKYNINVLPVVDANNVLLGVVTVDDVLDVYEDEVTEDIQKSASVLPFEVSYNTANVITMFKKRIIWLLMLTLGGTLTGSVISFFEVTLGRFIALASFIPVLIGTGGNIGTQSATLIIRALVTGDITPRRWFSVIKKEILVGLIIGVSLGCILGIWSYFMKSSLIISFVVGLSVIFISLWANIVGSLLPIVLRKLHLDPAVVSSPFISTILDVSGLLIYFSVALFLL